MEILIWLIIVIVFVSIIFITNTIELSTNFIDHTLYPELYILNTVFWYRHNNYLNVIFLFFVW